MLLISEEVEYRRSNLVNGKNSDYYLHTFEDDNSSYTFYCKNAVPCKKGDKVKLKFTVGVFDGKPNYNLVGIA